MSTPKGKRTNNVKNGGPGCCCSSSSDEAELVDTDHGGWPSAVSLLETPDRRRMRKSLRWSRRTASEGHANANVDGANKFPTSSPMTAGQKRNAFGPSSNAGAFSFSSPPVAKRPPSSDEPNPLLQSPTLHTPGIHLSGSPLRSFFIRERRQRWAAESEGSPKSSSSSASGRNAPVLKPLNLHNYIGIRFGGEQQSAELTRTQIQQNSAHSNGQRDENAGGNINFVEPQTTTRKPARISLDSGIFDISSSSTNSANASLIETPSKGLAVPTPSCCPFSNASLLLSASAASQPQQCSPKQLQLLLSPSNRVFRQPLLLEFGGTGQLLGDFHSPIPEQSYGPLEASIADGILDDLVKLQPCTSLGVGQQPSPPKTPGKGIWAFWRHSPRALSFERKLHILRRRSPRSKPSNAAEWWRFERPPLPTALFDEELFNESAKQQHHQGNAGPEEFALLFPKLECRQWQRMFGQTEDQLEVTAQARRFLDSAKQMEELAAQHYRQTRSAGLPLPLANECRMAL